MPILTGNDFNLSKAENVVMEIEELPEVSFFLTTFSIPGISTSTINIANPFKEHNEPGNVLSYEEFTADIMVDEKFASWKAVRDWVMEGSDGYSFTKSGVTRRTGNILITSNNMNPMYRITIRNMFPISLQSIQIDTQQAEPIPLTFSTSFQYESYDFIVL